MSETNNIKITGASTNDMFCKYSYEHDVAPNTTDEVTIKSKVPIHEDLKAAFANLDVHLAVICEEIPKDDIEDIDDIPAFDPEEGADNDPLSEKVRKFTVNQFSVDGTGENEGVTLTGVKRLSTGEDVKLTTPKVKYDDYEYPFMQELRIAVENALQEVTEYKNGKRAPIVVQTEMFADEEETK